MITTWYDHVFSMFMITTWYDHALLFVVRKKFSFSSHIKVWCFELQLVHIVLLRHSDALCFVPVQLNQSSVFENSTLRSSTIFTVWHWLALGPGFLQWKHAWRIWFSLYQQCFSRFSIFLGFSYSTLWKN